MPLGLNILFPDRIIEAKKIVGFLCRRLFIFYCWGPISFK